MVKKIILVGFFILFVFGVFSCNKAAVKVVVATDAAWPPMEFIADDELTGFDIDIMGAIADAAGFTIEFVAQPWDGIFSGLADGDYDAVISSVTILDERKEVMDFSEPYVNAGQVLVVKKPVKGVTLLADLVGKKVGALKSEAGADEIEKVKGVILKNYDEYGLAIDDLIKGRINGVVADRAIAADYVFQKEKYKEKLKITGKPFTEEYYGIVVKKGDIKTLEMINKGIAAIKKSGKLDELIDRWLK